LSESELDVVDLNELKRIDDEDRRPRYIQIADSIVDFIKSQNLETGRKLPSQNELAGRYGVSQLTIRHAILKLINEGVLIGKQGKGIFVARKRVPKHIGEIGVVDRSSGLSANSVYQFIEAVLMYPPQRIFNLLQLTEGSQTVRVRRKILADDNLVGMETGNFPLDVIRLFSEDELHHTEFLTVLNRNEETRVAKTDYTVWGASISDFDAELMDVSKDNIILMVYYVFYNREKVPVMAGRTAYLSDKIELQYSVSAHTGEPVGSSASS
jgi:GntR family frlABCD operon transcriptional regulator